MDSILTIVTTISLSLSPLLEFLLMAINTSFIVEIAGRKKTFRSGAAKTEVLVL